MHTDVQILDYMAKVHEKLARGGVFLTVKSDTAVNTMTIGWGGITNFWAKPTFIVPVRKSRHTYNIIEKVQEFTVSVPIEVDLRRELAYCGRNSGRDVNKFETTRLRTVPGKVVTTPVIEQCDLHFECRIVYKHAMDPAYLDQAIQDKWYPDYHTLYYGEILAAYRT